MEEPSEIRPLRERDPEVISAAFTAIGWRKPTEKYRRYLAEQTAGTRVVLIAELGKQFAGYVTLNWAPSYPPFAEQATPEIQDLNVLPQFRRRGIATQLLDHMEEEAAHRSLLVGIGVGLHPGYNASQRLYVRRGYVPDGRGVTCRDRFVQEGENVVMDDDLILHLTKELGDIR